MEAIVIAARSRLIASGARRRARKLNKILPLVENHAAEFRALAMERFPTVVRETAIELRRDPNFPDAATARAFALIRELSDRIFGKRHFDVQVVGAFAMIKGMLAEMATGEGKTLTATLVAGTAGLAGVPIHIVTVNDYLARRDAELMGPLYASLGLSVGVVVGGQNAAERRAAYACDITYCTNKELAFDYLRDRMVLGQTAGDLPLKMETLHSPSPRSRRLRLRGLHFALVDEADSVLVDEARTPLIISGAADTAIDADTVASALELAANLEAARRLHCIERRAPNLSVPSQGKRGSRNSRGRWPATGAASSAARNSHGRLWRRSICSTGESTMSSLTARCGSSTNIRAV